MSYLQLCISLHSLFFLVVFFHMKNILLYDSWLSIELSDEEGPRTKEKLKETLKLFRF